MCYDVLRLSMARMHNKQVFSWLVIPFTSWNYGWSGIYKQIVKKIRATKNSYLYFMESVMESAI